VTMIQMAVAKMISTTTRMIPANNTVTIRAGAGGFPGLEVECTPNFDVRILICRGRFVG
jgi:hypothetical protein